MGFLRGIGRALASSLFVLLLVVFAASVSIYAVLDKPPTVKKALSDSGVYTVLVENTLAQKQQQLSAYLPVDNPEVQKAIREAFSVSYLQHTTEHNIDVTYDWIHGKTDKPQYSADLSQPKSALAQNVSQLVEQKLAALPPCKSQIVTPTTVADVLNLDCQPVGIPPAYLVGAAEQGVKNSSLFDQVVTPVLTLQDEQGKSLTDSFSAVPKVYNTFILSLFVAPIILLLCALAIFFWSQSRRHGAQSLARKLAITGVLTILLAFLTVWALSKGAQWSAGSNNDLILIEGKIVDIARLVGGQLRNWLVGFGAGYILIGAGLFIATKIVNSKSTDQNKELNNELGYRNDIPEAGTMFDPSHGKKPEPGKVAPPVEQDKNKR